MGDWLFASTTLAVIAELSVTVWSALASGDDGGKSEV